MSEATHAKSMRARVKGDSPEAFNRFVAIQDRREANVMRRGGASKRSMKRHFNKQDYAVGSRAIEKFERDARRKQMALSPITEGSRGTARLGRMMKSLVRNQRQGKAIIGKRPEHYHIRALVSPNDPEVKKYHEDLRAGVAHMKKKDTLRRQINARTRAAAMRERGRAGLHPALPSGGSLSPSIPSPAHQGKPINVTGGYEHQENPKRIPSAVKKYRQASWRKMMWQGK